MPALVRTREVNLWGLTVTTVAGIEVQFAPPEDDDGAAGVRQPWRPTPRPPMSAAVDVEDNEMVMVKVSTS